MCQRNSGRWSEGSESSGSDNDVYKEIATESAFQEEEEEEDDNQTSVFNIIDPEFNIFMIFETN
jgi:hypothetical protein